MGGGEAKGEEDGVLRRDLPRDATVGAAELRLDERAGIAKVGIIDFQDTVLGPGAYDLASLLQDARIDVPEQLELALLTRYIKARRASDDSFDPAGFAELYAIMSAQRNTKLLGIFARLNYRDGKPAYLADTQRFIAYARRAAGRYRPLQPLLQLFDALENRVAQVGYTF